MKNRKLRKLEERRWTLRVKKDIESTERETVEDGEREREREDERAVQYF